MCKPLLPSLVKNHPSPRLGRKTQKGRCRWRNLFSLGRGENRNILALPYTDHFCSEHCPRQGAGRTQHQMRATCWDQVVKIFSVPLHLSCRAPEYQRFMSICKGFTFSAWSFLRLAWKLNNNINFSCPLVTSSHTSGFFRIFLVVDKEVLL